jgi:diguanylate cyclase (GGDEF)-like protein
MTDCHATHIIVAEDEPASRALLTRQLRKAGYEVLACENGKQALEAVRRETTCIVIADWMMPEMDGLELCRTVRGLSQMHALSFVYFILLTAHSDKEQIVAGLEAGADDYLTKPYHAQELLARLRAGERICALQTELMHRQIELHKVNGKLAVLNRQLGKLANTDSLTELANRRYVFDRLAETWSQAERSGQPLSSVMFDIDRFKAVNDTYGHAAGDQVLKDVAAAARQCVRRYDVLGRIGGEEFCVICPETTIEGAGMLAERIREAIGNIECVWNGQRFSVAVSVGVAERAADHAGPDALIAAADTMLYKAKQSGRNQTWSCDANGNCQRLSPEIARLAAE